jgi:hypothetical protein
MTEIRLRLTIADPVAGVSYSLQDPKSAPVARVVATAAPLSFDVPVKLSDDGRLTGPFVRREGKERRFVYIAIGGQAGDGHTLITRRAKIDIHDIAADLLTLARAGRTLAVTLPGRDRAGLPACATVKPLDAWRAL